MANLAQKSVNAARENPLPRRAYTMLHPHTA
ncbi:MAG: hypothetical protein JWQ24_767 [Tardiphaga sp.]|nr:hypothetical protein [Tardiphaga sp.]